MKENIKYLRDKIISFVMKFTWEMCHFFFVYVESKFDFSQDVTLVQIFLVIFVVK